MAFEHIELRDLNDRGASRRPRGGVHAVGFIALGFIAGSLVTILCLAGSTLVFWNWRNSQELDIQIPVSASTPVPKTERQSIDLSVDVDGNYFYNSEPISADGLREKLNGYAVLDEKERPGVLLSTSSETNYAHVKILMDICHAAGLTEIMYHAAEGPH